MKTLEQISLALTKQVLRPGSAGHPTARMSAASANCFELGSAKLAGKDAKRSQVYAFANRSKRQIISTYMVRC